MYNFENLFMVVGRQLFLFDLFKKYWIVNGSYWNRTCGITKMNSKNISDLRCTLRNAEMLQFTHIYMPIIEWLILTALWLLYLIRLDRHLFPMFRLYVSSTLFIHGYAILFQQYNKILARRRIAEIEEMTSM